MSDLIWRPVDLKRHAEAALAIRIDSYVVSFGNAELFKGREHYLAYLARRLEWDPGSTMHLWCAEGDAVERIVGQVELGKYRDDESIGYVNLYYLVPEVRDKGLGAMLDEYAVAFFRARGFERARLSVVATNARALRFYERRGWYDVGPRSFSEAAHPAAGLVRAMEKKIPRSARPRAG